MTFIILAGELKDADYCDTYGPFDNAEQAQTAADDLVKRGVIVIEPDDCMDYRIMGLINPADAKTPDPDDADAFEAPMFGPADDPSPASDPRGVGVLSLDGEKVQRYC